MLSRVVARLRAPSPPGLLPVNPGRRFHRLEAPLVLFKALLIAVWHDLSDVKLSEALEHRTSFRRFCGFSTTEATLESGLFVG